MVSVLAAVTGSNADVCVTDSPHTWPRTASVFHSRSMTFVYLIDAIKSVDLNQQSSTQKRSLAALSPVAQTNRLLFALDRERDYINTVLEVMLFPASLCRCSPPLVPPQTKPGGRQLAELQAGIERERGPPTSAKFRASDCGFARRRIPAFRPMLIRGGGAGTTTH